MFVIPLSNGISDHRWGSPFMHSPSHTSSGGGGTTSLRVDCVGVGSVGVDSVGVGGMVVDG